jgi:hypothetical protein
MSERAFLNVETSLTGRRWVGPLPEERRLAEAMAQIGHSTDGTLSAGTTGTST